MAALRSSFADDRAIAPVPSRPVAETSAPARLSVAKASAVSVTPSDRAAASAERVFRRLAPRAQRLFGLMGLLPGPDFVPTALAAAVAAGQPETYALLRELCAADLVVRAGGDRFAVAEPIRGYAARVAAIGSSGQARALQRWYDWYLTNALAAAHLLYPQFLRLDSPPTQTAIPPVAFTTGEQASAWLDAEAASLRAAITDAVTLGQARYAWLLADALRGRCWQRPDQLDWTALGQAALAAARRFPDVRPVVATYLCIADGHVQAGRDDEAIRAYQAVDRHGMRAGWLSGRAAGLGNLGDVARRAGRLADAMASYSAAIALCQATGRVISHAGLLDNMGSVHLALGRVEQAAMAHRRALAMNRQIGWLAGEARSLYALSVVLRAGGHLDLAERGLERAVMLYDRLGDRDGQAGALTELADVLRDAGRPGRARDHEERASRLASDPPPDVPARLDRAG